ncbi:hypothetical protein [Bradyrhizobium manausense]|uniref:hypothetical protein n=1 Tax=Bradyrhizobium manausense TaxID=989370 RepID=UPI003D9B178B
MADHGLAAVLHRQILHRDRTRAVAAMAAQGLHLGCVGAGQPGQGARETFLLRHVVGTGEATGATHRGNVDAHHLCRQHGLERVLRRDALQHRDHEGQIALLRLARNRAGFHQLAQEAMQRVAVDDAKRLGEQLLADARVGMVDHDAPAAELYIWACNDRGVIARRDGHRLGAGQGCRHAMGPLPAQAREAATSGAGCAPAVAALQIFRCR